MTSMNVITRFIYKENRYAIVKIKGYYCAINYKDIDEQGCLTKQLNGIQMHAAKTIQECIENCRFCIDVNELVKSGLTWAEAVKAIIQ